MRIKTITSLALIITSSLLLAGCTSAPPKTITVTQTVTAAPAPAQATTSPEVKSLIKSSVDTICTLDGKKSLTASDMQKFTDLSKKLNAYSGTDETYIHSVAKNMESLAVTYKSLEGRQLPADIQTKFTTGCTQAKASYQKAFGE